MNILKFQTLKSMPSLKVDDPNQILRLNTKLTSFLNLRVTFGKVKIKRFTEIRMTSFNFYRP